MNRNKLKTYAPQARREFIKAVTDRAAFYGLTADKIEPVVEQGDVAVIGGKAFPKSVAANRKLLEQRIARQGFEQVVEAMAYTWFNRFVAIRYMELHGYLDHGYRVLSVGSGQSSVGRGHSSAAGNATTDRGQLTADNTPEILRYAEHVQLPGLDREEVIELKLEGNKEAELYDRLLLAQCHALHKAMPFLFEPIDDETELLLPDNLLHSDSLIRKLVAEIPEEDWQEVEIIGWLYQFYISEEKRRVDGYTKSKPVIDEDIPAKTELYTPNWIVKYLVQNSLGRQWMATYPDSPLKGQMEYYIEPAEQTPEVQEQLKAITPTELNPEELTLLDPACGSGHILVEAYDLLKAIYQERGYRSRDIPRLILEKNLYGLEIDDRAAQLAAFALMMKARADDRRIFEADVQPNVLSIQESKGFDAREITEVLNESLEDTSSNKVSEPGVAQLIGLFEHGKTLGSFLRVATYSAETFAQIGKRVNAILLDGGLFERTAALSLKPLLRQARLLASKYDAVATNPPYMGGRSMNARVRVYAEQAYPSSKADTYAMFVERSRELTKPNGTSCLVTMHSWLFLSTFESMRDGFLSGTTLLSLVHLGARAFPEIGGEVVKTQMHSAQNNQILGYRPTCFRLLEGDSEQKRSDLLERKHCFSTGSQDDFAAIPGRPFAYWIGRAVRAAFRDGKRLAEIAHPTGGMTTGNNELFLRFWWEVSYPSIRFGCTNRIEAKKSNCKWFPYNKGGTFRKWYGNNELVVNWLNDGEEVIAYGRAYPRSRDYYFRQSITWTATSSSPFAARHSDFGSIFDAKGSCCFARREDHFVILAILSSRAIDYFLKILNPTLEVQVGDVGNLPVLQRIVDDVLIKTQLETAASECVDIARKDWDSHEVSWEFQRHPISKIDERPCLVRDSLSVWKTTARHAADRMARLQQVIDDLVEQEYGLAETLCNEARVDPTLYVPEDEEDIQRLISYAIGCMMGRYSLDEPGLIYAHSGNQGFDPSRYKTFAADQDGIIPITDTDWFSDDAANRFVQFIATAWPKEHLEENLKFVAESLGPKKDESPRDTIRRYLSQGFFKHHLSMYKRRPIYWLFSSGKQRAFECLVYLHRYNEGTLSRMRTEYVIPLQGKIDARIEQLREDITSATSTAHGKRLQKERDKLIKQQAELRKFDEKLRHYADLRISLDLDDGVKVNYGKFGDLLAEVKAVTGGN